MLFTCAALGWLAVILAAPWALAHGVTVLPAVVYEAGGLICHQRPDRSFHLSGVQLPVCGRCFGLYASGATGALLALVAARSSRREGSATFTRVLLATAAFPTAATIAAEWSGAVAITNVARAVAALPLGAVAGWIFVRGLRSEAAAAEPVRQIGYHA